MAAGPTSLLQAVDSESVQIDTGADEEAVYGQTLAPIHYFTKSRSIPLSLAQSYVGYGAVSVENSFGLYWQAFSDTGGLGSGGISVVGKVLIIPQNVRCSKGAVAKSTIRCLFMDAAPTIGTTTTTPAGVDHIYVNGPSTFNGSALNGIEEQEFDFGLRVATDVGQGGKLYPTKYWFTQTAPTMRFRITDLDLVRQYLTPVELTSSAAVMKFMNEGGTAGYQYTLAKARVLGEIRGAVGMLTVSAINQTTLLSGATY
jgi:hypothetical protein